jgi:hypothetical protein
MVNVGQSGSEARGSRVSAPERSAVRNFARDHTESNEIALQPWWEIVYRNFFPDFDAMCVEKDRERQLRGVDRKIRLHGGRIIHCEEKVRHETHTDVLLEFLSNKAEKTAGWIAKDNQLTDWFLYVFLPSQTVLMMPFQALRSAWIENQTMWLSQFRTKFSDNYDKAGKFLYATESCPVPIEVLRKVVPIQRFCWTKEVTERIILSLYDPPDSAGIIGISEQNLRRLTSIVRSIRLMNEEVCSEGEA